MILCWSTCLWDNLENHQLLKLRLSCSTSLTYGFESVIQLPGILCICVLLVIHLDAVDLLLPASEQLYYKCSWNRNFNWSSHGFNIGAHHPSYSAKSSSVLNAYTFIINLYAQCFLPRFRIEHFSRITATQSRSSPFICTSSSFIFVPLGHLRQVIVVSTYCLFNFRRTHNRHTFPNVSMVYQRLCFENTSSSQFTASVSTTLYLISRTCQVPLYFLARKVRAIHNRSPWLKTVPGL